MYMNVVRMKRISVSRVGSAVESIPDPITDRRFSSATRRMAGRIEESEKVRAEEK